MKFSLSPGETFQFPMFIRGAKPHLHIILTQADRDNEFVAVSVSSLKSHPRPDLTVVIKKGIHRFIKHDSIILYAMAKIWNIKDFRSYLQSGMAIHDDPIDETLLEEIKKGLFKSKFTKLKIKDFCRTNMFFS